jgi:hypothetical protein
MKKKIFKKLITLFTLVCVMSAFFVLPLQAATLSTATPNTTTVIHKAAPNPSLTEVFLRPMDPIQSWTESTQFRTYTSTYFQSLEQSLVAGALLWLLHVPAGPAFFASAANSYYSYWGGVGGHTGYMVIYYYWCPSNIPYSPYYIKKHIDYYANSGYTAYIASTDEYYYSTQPY